MSEEAGLTSEFSVYWWDAEDGYHAELRFVTAKKAMDRAASLAKGPAAMIGVVRRIIITDGGDCTVFDWIHGTGVVWPTEKHIREAGLRDE
jgi:hypothetical protein